MNIEVDRSVEYVRVHVENGSRVHLRRSEDPEDVLHERERYSLVLCDGLFADRSRVVVKGLTRAAVLELLRDVSLVLA